MSNLVKKPSFWPSTSSVDQFLNDNFLNWPGEMARSENLPRVNIFETNDDFMVEMAAPGMQKEDFHIELDNDTLTISSQISEKDEEKSELFTRKEFSYESFRRSFHIPNTVEADKIKAKYEDGLLRLVIPKREEAKRKPARTIKIS